MHHDFESTNAQSAGKPAPQCPPALPLPEQSAPLAEDVAPARRICLDRPARAHGIRRGLQHGPRVGRGPRTF